MLPDSGVSGEGVQVVRVIESNGREGTPQQAWEIALRESVFPGVSITVKDESMHQQMTPHAQDHHEVQSSPMMRGKAMKQSVMVWMLLTGCGDKEAADTADGASDEESDLDGDGHASPEDCDDDNPEVHPGAAEVPYNGTDDDCDAATPDDDLDGDGYGAAEDCDDERPDINPGAAEECGDDIDNDCSGVAEDAGDTWYIDEDGDGYGSPDSTLVACTQPDGYTDNSEDCADTDSSAFPGSTASEVPADGIDQNCDGLDACVDLTCDGIADMLVPAYYTGAIRLYTGPGVDPERYIDLPGVSTPWHVGTEDFNHDGYLDIVSTYSGLCAITWGSADGYLEENVESLTDTGGSTLLIEDLDQDGYSDLLVVGYTSVHDTMIWWGSASGLSEKNTTTLDTNGSQDVTATDLNADGYTDLLFPSAYTWTGSYWDYGGELHIFFGSVEGWSEDNVTRLESYGRNAIVEDLDQDGYSDIVMETYYGWSGWAGGSFIYWGSKDGWGEETTRLTTEGAYDVDVADLDGDGWLDIVFPASREGTSFDVNSRIYWGDKQDWGSSYSTLDTYMAFDVDLVDVDEDGHIDAMFSAWESSGEVQLYWGATDGSFGDDGVTLLTCDTCMFLSLLDADQDGINDIWAGAYQGTTSRLFLGADGWDDGAAIELDLNTSTQAAIMVGP